VTGKDERQRILAVAAPTARRRIRPRPSRRACPVLTVCPYGIVRARAALPLELGAVEVERRSKSINSQEK